MKIRLYSSFRIINYICIVISGLIY